MTRESEVKKHLAKRVKELGGEMRKVRWEGRNGAPDWRVMLPERQGPQRSRVILGMRVVSHKKIPGKCAWVELKATGKKPEAHQLREHARMRSLGETVLVLDSAEAIDAWLLP